MKKNLIKLASVCLIGFLLIGCNKTDIDGNIAVGDYDWFYRIGNSPIVYEKDTKIMYYHEYGGYANPYYDENGRLCRYIDGEIVPIE